MKSEKILFVIILLCMFLMSGAASGASPALALAIPLAADTSTTISINNVTVTEPVSGQSLASFTISASSDITQTVSVDYATSDGTAIAGSDYVAVSSKSPLTLSKTKQSAVVSVSIKSDTKAEGSETFFLNLFNVKNATLGTSQGVGTINDPLPTLSIGDRTVTEGNSGTVKATFSVSLSAASSQPVSVVYQTASGTAIVGSDFITTSGTLFFPANSTSAQSITVLVNGDITDEDNETFFVELHNPSNASILKGQGVGTITNDDKAPKISVNDVTVVEGNAGTSNAVFSLSLSAPSGRSVSVTCTTANGTAVGGSDYVSLGATTRTFPVGSTTITVSVSIIGDLSDENDETFLLNLSSPINATIQDGQGLGTITNDDQPPTLTITDGGVPEGNSGSTNATLTVSLSVVSGKPVSVDFRTIDGTATAGSDYTAIAPQTLVIPAGATNQNINVAITGDTIPEDNETLFVALSNPVNATLLDNQGQITINDNDSAPLISIDDVSVTEGVNGGSTARFTVSLSTPSGRNVTAHFATANGTALAGADYAPASGTVSFPPNVTSQTIEVPITGDAIAENPEVFFVNLSGAVNGVISDGQGVGTIIDGTGPVITIDNVVVGESASGTRNAIFSVHLSAASQAPVYVNYATANGTAQAGSDYEPRSGQLVIPANALVGSIVVPIDSDSITEANETFFLNLSNPTNATLGRAQATATIVDVAGAPEYKVFVPLARRTR
jgi:hypothetical protein